MYLKPVSTASDDDGVEPELLCEATRADDVGAAGNAGEDPLILSQPGGHLDRLRVLDRPHLVNARWVELGWHEPGPALHRERSLRSPVIAADPAGSSAAIRIARSCAFSACDTPTSEVAVPMPWQNAVTRPDVCSQISRPSPSRWPGVT